MYLKIFVLLMISTVCTLPSADAKPGLTLDKHIIVNIVGAEVLGDNQVELNEGSNGLVNKMEIEINQNISKIWGNNIIRVNKNIGSDTGSDASFQITATPSEDTSFQITTTPSEDTSFQITTTPSEGESNSTITTDKYGTTLVIAETTAAATTKRPGTTLVIAETTAAATTKRPAEPPVTSTTTAAPATTPRVPDCPSPWVLIGNECYFVFAEQPGSRWKNWFSARSYCQAKARSSGSDLAQPSDINALALHLRENYGGLSWWWIGGSDSDTEGDWHWLNGTAIASSDWARNQPDANGNCLLMWLGDTTGSIYGNLNDSTCGSVTVFVCQRY